MRGKIVYLASPYSKYPEGREEAFRQVCMKASELLYKGFVVFCPIAHSHSIEEVTGERNTDGDWWLSKDLPLLEHCDELLVYQMPGWQESYGVTREIEYAEQLGIPIKYLPYDKRTITKEIKRYRGNITAGAA